MYRYLFIIACIFYTQTACAQSFISAEFISPEFGYHPKERVRALGIDSIKVYKQYPNEQTKLSEISLYNRRGDVIKIYRRDRLHMSYQYDTLGKSISSYYFPDSSHKVKNTFVYDDNNNLIHFISQDTRDSIESSRFNYIYQNEILQKTECISKGEYLYEITCSYDDQNRLIREDWITYSKIERSFYYTYDKKNNIKTYTTIHATEGFLSKIIMKYNAENLKTQELYYNKNNQLIFAIKMHYRKDGLMSYKECFGANQNGKIKNGYYSKITYVYSFH